MNDRTSTASLSLASATAADLVNDSPLRNGARELIDALVELDVEVVFGYPGGAVLPIYDALYAEHRLRHVLVRHE